MSGSFRPGQNAAVLSSPKEPGVSLTFMIVQFTEALSGKRQRERERDVARCARDVAVRGCVMLYATDRELRTEN